MGNFNMISYSSLLGSKAIIKSGEACYLASWNCKKNLVMWSCYLLKTNLAVSPHICFTRWQVVNFVFLRGIKLHMILINIQCWLQVIRALFITRIVIIMDKVFALCTISNMLQEKYRIIFNHLHILYVECWILLFFPKKNLVT